MTDHGYFCAAPWTSLYLDPNGDVRLCCISADSIGNVHEQSMQSIVDGQRVREIKTDMLAGRPVETCNTCWRQHKSKRLQNFYNDRYVNSPRFPELDAAYYADVTNFKPKYLDLRWNNTCNFACIYCSPSLSSLWTEIDISQNLGAAIPVKPSRQVKQQILDWALGQIDGLDWIYLAGGEPLMIKENLVLLEKLYDHNPDCTLLVNSNLSLLEGNDIFNKIKRFKNVQWLISGEAMGDQYEYIRWPGIWQDFYRNLHTIKALESQGHSVSFHLVCMNLNSLAIWNYIDFLRDQKLSQFDHNITISLYNNRDSRYQWAVQRSSPEIKQRVREKIDSGLYDAITGVANLKEALDDPVPADGDDPNGLDLTVRSLAGLDRMRKLDSRSVFPEIYEYYHNSPKIQS